MNIKQHIEAGHYPKDEKGRALVPMANGKTATVASVFETHGAPLLGWSDQGSYTWWDASGRNLHDRDYHLSPPPPRKVEVKAWAIVVDGRLGAWWTEKPRDEVKAAIAKDSPLVELTGSYEEPWIK